MSTTTWNPDLERAALELMNRALRQDLGDRGDVTSKAVISESARGRGRIVARASGIIAGVHAVARFFEDGGIGVTLEADDGSVIEANCPVLRFNGPLRAVLARERSALNLLAHLSGVATLTGRFVGALGGIRCRVLDTRKTIAGFRHLAKYAVACGGGSNHRIGLHDMILLKENHIVAAGGIASAVRTAHRYAPDLPIELEVRDLEELEEALPLGLDRIMLDNFSLSELKEAVARVAGRVPLEASGGIDLDSVASIGATGVDCVSVGALTHSAPALDLSLLLEQDRSGGEEGA